MLPRHDLRATRGPALLVLALFFSIGSPLARALADADDRLLSAYRNDDGSRPDGTDAARDDTSALRKALADGPGVVRVGRGRYRWGDVQVPEGVTLVGAGKATIVRSSGPASIFRQANVADWAIRDLVLDGEAEGDWRQRRDDGKSGLTTERCGGYEVSGVAARNFDGPGFDFTRSRGTDGGRVQNLTATGCRVGVRFGVRGEYIVASGLVCRNNVVGCVVHAGNASISGSNFCDNVDGMLIEDRENGSHGAVSNCLFNHNDQHALLARQVKNGMAIGNCCFFYGTLRLEEAAGVTLTSSLLSCSVKSEGKSANRFAGNHIILLPQWKFSFAPKDIVEGNFTAAGPWTP